VSPLRFDQDPHRRFNPLKREWVLVSPQRTARPCQGLVEKAAAQQTPPHGYFHHEVTKRAC
jgi:UDPglucose--hexose-1-phosphate uridylyltransferase